MISELFEAQREWQAYAELFSDPIWGIFAILFTVAVVIYFFGYVAIGLRTV